MDMYEAEKRLQEVFQQPLKDYQKRRGMINPNHLPMN